MGSKGKSKSNERPSSRNSPGPGTYNPKSFADQEIKPNVLFGSSPRFPKPITSQSQQVGGCFTSLIFILRWRSYLYF